jgi:hypothetical protein
MKNEPANMTAAGIINQKLKLFMRAKAMSDAPICSGIIQLAKPTKGGHDGAEHHDQAVHGGELVEQLRIDQLQTRLEQLSANQQSQNAANHEHGKAEQQVQSTNVFVVGGIHPTAPARRRTVVVMVIMTVGLIVRMENSAHLDFL